MSLHAGGSNPQVGGHDAHGQPQPLAPIVVVPHDVSVIDAAIRDVIHAAGNLKAKSSRHRTSPDPGFTLPVPLPENQQIASLSERRKFRRR